MEFGASEDPISFKDFFGLSVRPPFIFIRKSIKVSLKRFYQPYSDSGEGKTKGTLRKELFFRLRQNFSFLFFEMRGNASTW